MEKTKLTNPFTDKILCIGLFAITLSASFFMFFDLTESSGNSAFGVFFINYIFTIGYTITVLIAIPRNQKWRFRNGKIEYTIIMLILWLISAFSLNKEMNIFDQSTSWLCCFIFLFCISLLISISINSIPLFFKHVIYFIIGSGIILFTYYSFYLFPLYFISIPAAIAIGFSLHSFVPLFIVIITSIYSYRSILKQSSLKYSFALGLIFPFVFSIIFIISWNRTNDKITFINHQYVLSEGKLPNWAVISQSINKGFVAERIIKADLVYKTFNENADLWFGGFNSRSFEEPKQHDPLVILASLFSGKPNLNEDEKIKILESMYDSRHQAQERLWSGDELVTNSLTSNVRIFPEYRIAYTEKIIEIKNSGTKWWNNNQEAIYTFHLSEGAVVSSLSLWIDGKEEKAYLTSKSKADSAYKTIVGTERRDPSVIHWQEGNTVSVRVFPCNSSENRRFKIGITSPLIKKDNNLSYENIYFDGPTSSNAKETIQLTFSKKPEDLNLGKDFDEVSAGKWQQYKNYDPNWELTFKATQPSSENFTFNHHSYQLKNYTPTYHDFSAKNIYLDLNNAWTKNEFEKVWNTIKDKKVYAYEDEIIQLTEVNKDEIFNRMNKLNFSLFPIYKINNIQEALLISKSNPVSPNLADLKGSTFSGSLNNYLTNKPKINLYNIGYQLSPYLKSLKEFRTFNYDFGSISKLNKILDKNLFIQQTEGDNNVILDQAGLIIEKSKSEIQGKAPDHLLRLFAYNHVMKELGKNYFKNNFYDEEIIKEAEEANIVSPVSSLIVLETKKDYERFNIDESKNSLKNASMKSSGAVPEPHEWMLIILTAFTVMYLIYKPKFANSIN